MKCSEEGCKREALSDFGRCVFCTPMRLPRGEQFEKGKPVVFVMVWSDHHQDDVISLHRTLSKAVRTAEDHLRLIKRLNRFKWEELTESAVNDGWVAYGKYSDEGDTVTIYRKRVQ